MADHLGRRNKELKFLLTTGWRMWYTGDGWVRAGLRPRGILRWNRVGIAPRKDWLKEPRKL